MSASLSAQVAELERERDGYEREYLAEKAALAAAKVEGARELAVKLRQAWNDTPKGGDAMTAMLILVNEARAAPAGEEPECPAARARMATPPSAPEPLRIVVQSLHSSGALVATPMSVLISPADARRIVSLATSTEASK